MSANEKIFAFPQAPPHNGEPPALPYVEFAVASNFSFLRGASHAEELMRQAESLRLTGLGLCDRNSVAGVVRAHAVRRENALSLRYHPGARLVFCDGTPDILAYPQDKPAWSRLCRLLTAGNLRAEKGDCILVLDDLLAHAEGLALIAMPGSTRDTPPRFLHHARESFADDDLRTRLAGPSRKPAAPTVSITAALKRLRDVAGDRLRLAATMLYRGNDRTRIAARAKLAAELGLPLIAVNDVLYHHFERRGLQDVITCIRERLTIDRAGRVLAANAERYLKPGAEMARLFADHPGAITETLRMSETLTFSLDELKYQYPDESIAGFASAREALAHLVREGAARRFPRGVPAHVAKDIAHELNLIAQMQYEPYFLTVYDIVRFARSKEILCQGRGSAANSAVCYCLGITEVDPSAGDLLFERFISIDRNEPPDIDVDFEHERREEVIQYIYEKYGRHRTGIAATVISYRGRSAIREIGKAFGLSEDMIGALASSIWGMGGGEVRTDALSAAGLDPQSPRVKHILALAQEIRGFPRHLSQHVGGFVITRGRLDEVIPIMNGAMDARTHVEWDKDDLDVLGILKVDVLGLGMLTCMRKALALMAQHYPDEFRDPETGAPLSSFVVEDSRPGKPRTLDLSVIPKEEPEVYDMLCRADSLGVFQVESRAQMSMLPRLRPREFYDLVIEVAIVRPGPIQGDMVHPYLRRRQARETVTYPSPELESVLKKTLGVPLFQEQAMRIAIVAGGFTPGEADRLRRAMATFKRTGTIGTFRSRMVEGMKARGYDAGFAERCFSQIEGFGEYGFPESHAASFAQLVYASAWLKCRYPDVFAAALLNAQPMGFYAPAQIIRDATDHGVPVRPADVNASDYDTTLEPAPHGPRRLHALHGEMAGVIRSTHALRLGLRAIRGFGDQVAGAIVAARQIAGRTQPYRSVRDLWMRTKLDIRTLERLADADAFGSLGLTRRQAMWAVKALGRAGDQDVLPLMQGAQLPLALDPAPTPSDFREPVVALPAMSAGEEVVSDYRFLSLSLRAHPASFLRQDLARRGVTSNEMLRSLPNNALAHVSGLVTVRQRPGSANGVIFMTIEDETGIANIIVWPPVFERFRPVVMGARYVGVRGRMQKESGVIHVVADRLDDLTFLLARLSADVAPPEALARADAVKHPHAEDRPRSRVPARTPGTHPRRESAQIAADFEITAPGSAHAPTRRGNRH